MSAAWTHPYYGVSHLLGLRAGFQVTVEQVGELADCLVFTPGCGFSAQRSQHSNLQAARKFGQSRAKELFAFAEHAS